MDGRIRRWGKERKLRAAFALACSLLLLILWATGCKKSDVGDSESESPMRDDRSVATKKVMDMTNPAYVEVANGESAVVSIPEGFILIVPHKVNVSDGDYKVVFSKTGDFVCDSTLLKRASGVGLDMRWEFFGHTVQIEGGSASTTLVGLGFFEYDVAIAKYRGTEPKVSEIEGLDFLKNPEWDDDVFMESMKEELKRLGISVNEPNGVR